MSLRITARWIAPVTAPLIERGALLVARDGTIEAVGPAGSVPAPPGAEHIELGESIVLPGLVNTHAHPELAMMRGLLEDLPFHEWIPSLMRVKLATPLTDDDYLTAARATCVESIAAGITTIGATEDSASGLVALGEAGLRGVLYREVFGPAPEHAEGAVASLRAKVETMRERASDLVRLGVSPHAPYTVSDELFTAVARLAAAQGLPVAVHVAESEAEQRLVLEGDGPFAERLARRGIATPRRARSTVALLERTGVLSLRPLLIHAVLVDAADIRLIADAGAAVAHCPVANARLGNGIAPVQALLDAGVTVGLGTDSVVANNRMDLLEEARFAQMLQRARTGSGTVLPAATLLRLATIDGARALGLDDVAGSLEPGKDADVCAVSLDRPHVRPVHDPLAALFHAARASDVTLTVVRGRVLYRCGRFTTVDATGTRVALDAVADRIRAALRTG